MILEPIGQRVIIKRKEAVKSVGSIMLTEKFKKLQDEGIVVSVGPQVKTVKPDDRVMIGTHTGIDVEVEALKFFYCDESDIFAIIKEKK